MFTQLSSYKGERIVVELANGKQLAGTVIEVDPKYLRMETAEGLCVILILAIHVVWEKTGAFPDEEIAFQSMAVQDKKMQADLEQMCTLRHARPCTMAFSQPCTQAYGQPCYQMFGQQPGQPCYQMFGMPCPQAFMPQYEDQDPCFRRFGAPCYHSYAQSEPYGCYGRFGHIGRPCYALFGGGGYPFPTPYPYPPYPYPPYPIHPIHPIRHIPMTTRRGERTSKPAKKQRNSAIKARPVLY